jgi:hypothetical protein
MVGKEGHQVRERPAGTRAERAKARDIRREDERLMRNVEPGHADGDATLGHDLGGFRIAPDVEFRRGGRVSLSQGAAHDRDFGDPVRKPWHSTQQKRDVGQRARRDDRDRLGRLAQDRRRQLECRDGQRRSNWLGQLGAVEARWPVEIDWNPWLAI